jgi:hypothetical protein
VATIPSFIAPSTLTWLGIARELYVGTPVAPTNTIPLDKGSYSPEDTPKFLPDEAIRGVMTPLFNEVRGVEDATMSFGGPAFLDVGGFWLDNLFGDLSTTSSGTLGSAQTLNGSITAAATTLTVSSTIGTAVSGAVMQITDGSASEIVVLSQASAGTTFQFTNYPTRFAHGVAATASVQTVDSGYVHKFAILNTGNGQPPTHSVTDFTNLTASTGARTYPSTCLSSLEISGNAEQLLMMKVSGNSWLSAAAAARPVNTTSFVIPLANWRSTVTVGGTQIYNIGEWSIKIARQLQTYWTAQNGQNPFIIARGGLTISGDLDYSVAQDESPLTNMLTAGYLPVVITISNGLATTSLLSMTITTTTGAFIKSAPERNAVLVGYKDAFEAVANSTDVGGSGGLGPGTISLSNNIATY